MTVSSSGFPTQMLWVPVIFCSGEVLVPSVLSVDLLHDCQKDYQQLVENYEVTGNYQMFLLQTMQ